MVTILSPTHTLKHTHQLAPFVVVVQEKEISSGLSALNDAIHHGPLFVQVFTVRTRRKGDGGSKRQPTPCLDGRWRGGWRPSKSAELGCQI